MPEPAEKRFKGHWSDAGHWIKGHLVEAGHGPGSQLLFLDRIPGPCILERRPGESEPRYNELEAYKKTHPERDWDAIFAERYGKN